MRGLIRTAVDDLLVCPEDLLRRALTGEATPARHAALLREVTALHVVEVRPVPPSDGAPQTIRLACWNLERGRHREGAAALLARTGATVALLSEMDLGMARTGNRHTTRELAGRLGWGYAFGLEYVELGLGIGNELVENAGRRNKEAFHGNAVVSRLGFRDVAVIPIDESGLWFGFDWHHRRLGGRLGLAVTLTGSARPVVVVSTHFENHSTPEQRADQMRALLAYVETLDPTVPVVIGGDLNTAALPPAAEPGDWFERPHRHEPLFSLMDDAGFDWRHANTAQHTRRVIADGRPAPVMRRVDWIFVRGLTASRPTVWPAIDEAGLTLSDHELLTVDLTVP